MNIEHDTGISLLQVFCLTLSKYIVKSLQDYKIDIDYVDYISFFHKILIEYLLFLRIFKF